MYAVYWKCKRNSYYGLEIENLINIWKIFMVINQIKFIRIFCFLIKITNLPANVSEIIVIIWFEFISIFDEISLN